MNIGILGASFIAQKAIIEPAAALDHAQVIAVGCRDESRGTAYANEHGIEQVFQDYDDLITSDKVDVVYVGLPPVSHAYWSKRALAAGKHVLCEKPFAMNLAEAEGMLAAADQSTARLVEAFHTAYHPSFTTCLGWIKEGRIGRVTSIDAHFGVPLEDDGKRNQFRPEAGGGSVMDMGCYPLQWADACAQDKVRSISAKPIMTSSNVDGSMAATVSYENGTTANISCSMTAPGTFSAGMTVTGTEGSIQFDDPLVPQDDGTLVLRMKTGEVVHHDVSGKSTYHYQLDTVLRALKSGAALPTEGAPIWQQQKLIDDVYYAAGLGHLRSDYVA